MLSLVLVVSIVVGVFGVVRGSDGSMLQKPVLDTAPASHFDCDIAPVLDPEADGLPSASELFSSHDAIMKQVSRHQAIVRVPTICYNDLGDFDDDERWKPFENIQKVLNDTYPLVHEHATLDKINTYGLVYTFQGSDESLAPILLTAHQDVVPVENEQDWEHPPFEGHYDGETLWGRGAADDKSSLTALMSAMESLLSHTSEGPRRTSIFAFGFDEECSGYRGAGEISAFLEKKYGTDGIAVILDEGSTGMQQIGETLYALPAVYEKGYLDVWFDLEVLGGHSSTPPSRTSIGMMSEIVVALETNPFEPRVIQDSPVYNHMVCLARYSPRHVPHIREMLRWKDLRGLTRELAGSDPATRYLIQTSQAVDLIRGGNKINSLPKSVKLGVNYRVAPQDTLQSVQYKVAHLAGSIARKYNLRMAAYEDDREYQQYVRNEAQHEPSTPSDTARYNGVLELKTSGKFRPTPVAPTTGPIWEVFSGTIRHSFASGRRTVVPVGVTMNGNTDTRHYLHLSKHVYRWTPIRERPEDLNTHTVDEGIKMSSHMESVKFYYDLLRNFDAADF